MSKSKTNGLLLSQDDLPSCLICGAPSTGVHYGVISCEACKTFFRRYGDKVEFYECAEDRRCDVVHNNRTSCHYCRIQKCLKAGMSKDAVVTGRRSCKMSASILKMKESADKTDCCHTDIEISSLSNVSDNTKCIKKPELLTNYSTLKSLDTADKPFINDNITKMAENFTINSNSMHTETDSNEAEPKTESCTNNSIHIGTDRNVSSELNKFPRNDDISDGSPESTVISNHIMEALAQLLSSTTVQDDPLDHLIFTPDRTDIFTPNSGDTFTPDRTDMCAPDSADLGCYEGTYGGYSELNNSVERTVTVSELNSCDARVNSLCNGRGLYNPEKVDLYERAIRQMSDMHRDFSGGGVIHYISEGLSDIEHEYAEMVDLKKKVFGRLEPLPADDYARFYKETGLDIDGRREMMIGMLPLLKTIVFTGIDFIKTIPGFSALCIQDKIELSKVKFVESYLIGIHRCFNIEHKLHSPFPGKIFHLDDMIRLEGERALFTYQLHYKLNKLNLTEHEIVVLAALAVMNTDECCLIDGGAVQRSQDFLLECLFYLFSKHDSESLRRFARVVSCLIELKNVRDVYFASQESFFKSWMDVDEIGVMLHDMSPMQLFS